MKRLWILALAALFIQLCLSAAVAQEVINNRLTLLETKTTLNPNPVQGGPAGTFTVATRFRNILSDEISKIAFRVVTLTGGNLLLNADGGPGGASSVLTVGLGGDYADGVLSPNEIFTVNFVIGLATRRQFQFFVDALGMPLSSQPVGAIARVSTDRVVFESPSGAVILEIPLKNETKVEPTPTGDHVTTTQEIAVLSDDRTRAGIFTWITSLQPSQHDGPTASTFRYYGGEGLLWQMSAPPGRVFMDQKGSTRRLLSTNGGRVALIAVESGSEAPVIQIVGSNGSTILALPEGAFIDFRNGALSPTGRYLLVDGTVLDSTNPRYVVRVVDIDQNQASEVTFDLLNDEPPSFGQAPDDRFVVEINGIESILPQN